MGRNWEKILKHILKNNNHSLFMTMWDRNDNNTYINKDSLWKSCASIIWKGQVQLLKRKISFVSYFSLWNKFTWFNIINECIPKRLMTRQGADKSQQMTCGKPILWERVHICMSWRSGWKLKKNVQWMKKILFIFLKSAIVCCDNAKP